VLWALRGVSFEVKRGEVVGIIGRNGAGKSTLLKILSRITEPTEGRAEIHGRVGSLLEVGTGMHPELTGRENIYLNGCILGMRKAEIDAKFDEIVDFSGIERFIDTPVKRYSSGMRVRLGFAIAAHLEPEILVVDEVLAVGDVEFQKRCLGKMKDVAGHGRTVLFVSHNMTAVKSLCGNGICLDDGEIVYADAADATVDAYLARTSPTGFSACRSFDDLPTLPFQMKEVYLADDHGVRRSSFTCDEPVNVVVEAVSREPVPAMYGYFTVGKASGEVVLASDSRDVLPNRFDSLQVGPSQHSLRLPARLLGPGEYVVSLGFASHSNKDGHLVHAPGGKMLRFSLADPNTCRGDKREGHLSTLIAWRPLAELDSEAEAGGD